MEFDWESGGLAEGLHCYNRGEFFETHEHWEGVWNGTTGRDRLFLQALIQITVAFHHLGNQNMRGFTSLLTRALHKLRQYPASYGGVEVERLRGELELWLAWVDGDMMAPRAPMPRIR